MGVVEGSELLEVASTLEELFAQTVAEPQLTEVPRSRSLISEIDYLPPLEPLTLRDFMAFEDHAKAGAARRGESLADVWYERPIYYKGNPLTVIGHNDSLVRPPFTKALDFELEVACVLGRPLLDATPEQAEEAIFGFTIMCDWSARDVQKIEMAARLGPAKSKDFATSLGPALITADEVGSHPALGMAARLNGETLVEADLSDAHWSFPEILSFVSQGEQLHPAEVFGSGTPLGGCLLDHGGERWLEPGDIVELEVDGIGTLSNTVA